MPTFKALGGLTAVAQGPAQYAVVGGMVELPDNETWWDDLVRAGLLEAMPAPDAPEAPQGPTLAETPAQGELTPPVAPEAATAQETAPVAPAPAGFVTNRRGGRR